MKFWVQELYRGISEAFGKIMGRNENENEHGTKERKGLGMIK